MDNGFIINSLFTNGLPAVLLSHPNKNINFYEDGTDDKLSMCVVNKSYIHNTNHKYTTVPCFFELFHLESTLK